MQFYQYKDFLRQRYGQVLHRVPLDLGLGCPHRQGAEGGCTFCAESGGRARQTIGLENLRQQIQAGAEFARRRYRAENFMLYLQAHTSTFIEAEKLEPLLRRLLREEKFSALSLGTRPDCLGTDIMELLSRINQHIDVWIELGVQSTHDKTLKRINRGHNWRCSREAIKSLSERGLKVAPHVIVGLPGENSQHWNQTARRLAQLPIDALKIHNLHVVKGTPLAREFAARPFPVLNEHQYAAALIDFLRRIPPQVPIMRVTTDTPKEELIAPLWEMSKGRFLEFFRERMRFSRVRQGDLTERAADSSPPPPPVFSPITTDDGSVTFWSEHFKEHFHAKIGALTEAEEKFIKPSGLRHKISAQSIRLLDICFGLGYNSLAACEAAESAAANTLSVTALEIDLAPVMAAGKHLRPPANSSLDWSKMITELNHCGHSENSYSTIKLIIGDARAKLDQAAEDGPFDIIFLDAFSTQRNAELWTLDYFRRLKSIMTEDGILLTYCAALPVRGALSRAGFAVGETAPVGRSRGGTIAAKRREHISRPLSEDEFKLLWESPRGLPYRDPAQVSSNREILRRREAERRQLTSPSKRG